MTILTRIARLFKADMHGILDQLEEPETMLKQAIRDMQEAIDHAVADLNALILKHEKLQEKQQQVQLNRNDLQQQLHFCLVEGNEVLAKSVIRKKLQAEFSLQELTRQLKQMTDDINTQTKDIQERQEKLHAIRDKLALFCEAMETVQPTFADAGKMITQDDVELAFLLEKQRYTKTMTTGGQL